MDDESEKIYPAIYFLLMHGRKISNAIALFALIWAIWLWVVGYSAVLVVAIAIGGALMFLLLHSYVEMVRVIADMLLPK